MADKKKVMTGKKAQKEEYGVEINVSNDYWMIVKANSAEEAKNTVLKEYLTKGANPEWKVTTNLGVHSSGPMNNISAEVEKIVS